MGVSKDYWDPAYRDGSFRARWDYDFPAQELIGALSALDLPKGARVLDLGCGGGRDALYLAQCGYVVSAIDFSAEAIAVCRQRATDTDITVDWKVGDVLALPFGDESFDLVCDRACFHHIADQDRPRYVAEVHRTLKPSACLLLRGSSESREDSFFAVDQQTVGEFFCRKQFDVGRMWPITLNNNSGKLTANMVLIRKRG